MSRKKYSVSNMAAVSRNKLLASPLEIHRFEPSEKDEYLCTRCRRPRALHSQSDIEERNGVT